MGNYYQGFNSTNFLIVLIGLLNMLLDLQQLKVLGKKLVDVGDLVELVHKAEVVLVDQ